ncbi:MAG TPA: helix-turn-helix transcriptional regulator [Ignavibacteriales bacterium]|nr:helix-turn-helix transcriptional regulator [Ignavibacteriales bacterium]
MPETHENVEIGSRLRDFLERKFTTIAQAERKLGKGRNYLSQYITGRSLPGAPLLKDLAKLGCDITWLLTGEEPVTTAEISEKLGGLAKQRELEKELTELKAFCFDLSRKYEAQQKRIEDLEQTIKQKDEAIEMLFVELGKVGLATSQLQALRNIFKR